MSNLTERYEHLCNTRAAYRVRIAEQEVCINTLKGEQDQLVDLVTKFDVLLKVSEQELTSKLDEIVNNMLKVFEFDNYVFCSEFTQLRGCLGLEMYLLKNGERIELAGALGGGLLDILAIVLRVYIMLITSASRILILDEPFKFLSAAYKPKLKTFLNMLKDIYEFQFIIVTHDTALLDCANIIYEVTESGKVRLSETIHA